MCTAPATLSHIVHTNFALGVDTLLKRFEHLSLRCLQHVIGLDSHYTNLEKNCVVHGRPLNGHK